MHKIKSQTAPAAFQNRLCKPAYKHPTYFSTSNYCIPPFKLSKSASLNTEFQSEAPHYGRIFHTNSEKMQENLTVFKNPLRKKIFWNLKMK